ncbi:MAG TPA: hemolysin III family protein [Gaiellaceae bacterium]
MTVDDGSRPLLRGVLHQAALVVAVAAGVVFVVETDGSRRTVAAAVFAASAATMLAVSAIYHRVTWTPRARLRMRRADHAGIYILIAGTYTPVGLLALHGVLQKVVLGVVWTGAAAAIVLKLAWVHAPKWLSAAIAIGLGWIGVAAIPQLIRADGVTPVVLIAAGGLAYTAGGIVYARRRPDPFPAVFGYHELFHALTLVGLGLQYAAIAFFVIRPA